MEKEFKILNHTADAGVIAYGNNVSEAFANAAKGMFSLITELENVEEIDYRDTEITASDQETLLVEWLNELIYLFDAEGLIFKRFDITELSDTRLRATIYGEKINPARHRLKTGFKAATYHLLRVDRDKGCRVQVIFDV